MDNKHFPPLEPENTAPEVFPEIPERMEPLDEAPVIKEISFEQETFSEEVDTEEEPIAVIPDPACEEALTEEIVLEDIIPEELPTIEEIPANEEIADESTSSAMESVSTPEEGSVMEEKPREGFLEIPTSHPEILADDHAMDYHGLLGHGEEEPPFDLRILDDPELTPEEAQPAVEEVVDQEYRDNGQEFDAMFHASAPEPDKKKPEEPTFSNKGRPKRKKGEGLLGIPSILATFVWLALIVIIGVTAGRMLWVCAADVLAFGRADEMVTVTVYEADTMDDIIDKLHECGLIRYKSLFKLYADISDAQEDIKPGIYDLNKRYDYHALVNFMSPRSSREVIKLTIPEGYTCRQIFSLLEENRICTAVDAAAYAADGNLTDYWFLEGVERGTDNCLEGYLFPDTYEFYKNSTPKEAVEKMLDNFAYRFDEEMLAQVEAVNSRFGSSYGVREIVIIASLIEKESAAPVESPAISGVIFNRLFNWGSNPPYLNIDASIVYAQEGENSRIDTSLDSPYNTYTNTGLTPGPIANPGLSSLKAALNPESHNYYYYVLNPATGMHQFSTTYEEHSNYVRQFAAATED